MKNILRKLHTDNKKAYEVWSYLWLYSDESNAIVFTHYELCVMFAIPRSTLHRIMVQHLNKWNAKVVFVEIDKIGNKQYRATFYPRGKKKQSKPYDTIHDFLYDWTKEYYNETGFVYTELPKHKKYVKTICNKIVTAMKDRGSEVTEENTKETYKIFFTNIDGWWKESGNITLPLINKHFTKILNQIKSKSNGTKTRDSYSKAVEGVKNIDFGELTKKQ